MKYIERGNCGGATWSVDFFQFSESWWNNAMWEFSVSVGIWTQDRWWEIVHWATTKMRLYLEQLGHCDRILCLRQIRPKLCGNFVSMLITRDRVKVSLVVIFSRAGSDSCRVSLLLLLRPHPVASHVEIGCHRWRRRRRCRRRRRRRQEEQHARTDNCRLMTRMESFAGKTVKIGEKLVFAFRYIARKLNNRGWEWFNLAAWLS